MFDDQSLDIPCPRCSRKTAKTIRWLKTHDHAASSASEAFGGFAAM